MSAPSWREVAFMAATGLAAAVLVRMARGCRWTAERVRRLSAATRRVADRLEKR